MKEKLSLETQAGQPWLGHHPVPPERTFVSGSDPLQGARMVISTGWTGQSSKCGLFDLQGPCGLCLVGKCLSVGQITPRGQHRNLWESFQLTGRWPETLLVLRCSKRSHTVKKRPARCVASKCPAGYSH